MDLTDLAVNGADLIKELKLKPSPVVGQILNELLDKVLQDPQLNTKKLLLKEAKQILQHK